MSYTNDDSEVLTNREGRLSSQQAEQMQRPEGKSWKKTHYVRSYSLKSRKISALSDQGLKRSDSKKNSQGRGFSIPPLQVLVSAQYSLEFTGMRTLTVSTHSQISKASAKFPHLSLIKTLFSTLVSWTGQLTVQSSSCHRVQSPWATTCFQAAQQTQILRAL